MNPDDPRHGTNAGAQAHWKHGQKPCEPCRRAAKRFRQAAELRKLHNESNLVPLGPEAWAAIDSLPRKGLSEATGLRVSWLCKLHAGGPDRTVRRSTRNRILSANQASIPTPVGIQRRLRALACLGYTAADIKTLCGGDLDNYKKLRKRADSPEYIKNAVIAAVTRAYSEWHMTPAPASRTASKMRTVARQNGYSPPMAWDNIDTDPRPRAVTRGVEKGRPRLAILQGDDAYCARCGVRRANGSNTSDICIDCKPLARWAS